jgi:dienelactone hydrolase
MIQKVLFSVLFIVTFQTFGQTVIDGTSYSHFQIKSKKDTIDFVIADTSLSVSKPLLLFCQGSQPVPLFFDFGERGIIPVPLSNFSIEELNKTYHVAVISMPKTPLIAGKEHLNKQYIYVTDTARQHSYSLEYHKADYSENYVQRANKVLSFLKNQRWVESDKIVVAGHSQGARVAVNIASSNKNVTHLGLFGYNPHGRIDQSIRQIRKDAEAGKISWERADSLQQEQYDFYETIQNPDSVEVHPSLTSWKSFSEPTIRKLTQLKIPVYIAYGSEDTNSDLCDLLPLYFIENGKENYSMQRYPNLEHNFFPLEENGRPDHSSGKWELVMNEFIKWTKNTANNK